jgi:DMSO reductase family type II enzyme heme b subunit
MMATSAPLVLVMALLAQQTAPPGKAVYDKWCAECHGAQGKGNGAAALTMLPRPRDFTQARYQVRSTSSGSLPTDADIHGVLERGMPGTAMPAWPKLSQRERDDVVAYLKTFSRFFQSEAAPQALDFGKAPGASAERIADGRKTYDKIECWKCHGRQGRGDGPSAPTQEDDNNHPIRPANLTENWRFNGGGTVADIYARLRTGLDGTPMPSFSDLLDSKVITDEQLWNVALFVRSLAPEQQPEPSEVIRARLITGELPATVDAQAWEQIEPAYIPLVGQIIAKPRWFAPTVNTVWVKAAHNGRELALLLSWDDPSRSPDAAWDEWRTRITSVMEPKDAPATAGALPDAFAVQFAARAGEGRDLPYFLNGDASNPVYLWQWRSDTGVTEMQARGLDKEQALSADNARVQAQATFRDGRWQLLLRRTLSAQDTANRASFATATPLPIAFAAWDGSNGESGGRRSISSWYFIYLEQPLTAGVYITPAMAAAITALLAFLLVMRAQKQHRGKDDSKTSQPLNTSARE